MDIDTSWIDDRANEQHEQVDDVFQALSAQPRRELLLLLSHGEASVGELANQFEISRPAISKHLKTLKHAGLVESRTEGRKNIYHINHEPLQDVLVWLTNLDQFWADHLEDVEKRLEEQSQR